MPKPDPYEVFAIRYATLGGRRAGENFIGGDPHERGSSLDQFIWLSRRAGGCTSLRRRPSISGRDTTRW